MSILPSSFPVPYQKLIGFIRNAAGKNAGKLFSAAIVAGLASTLIIVVLIQAAESIENRTLNFAYVVQFLLSIGTFIFLKQYLSKQMSVLAQDAVCDFRIQIANKIRKASCYPFEKIGQAEVVTTLTDQTGRVAAGAVEFSKAAPSCVMLVFAFGYVLLLSTTAFWLSLIAITIPILIVRTYWKKFGHTLHDAIIQEGVFFQQFQHLLNGFKEIKVDRKKREDLFDNYLSESSINAGAMNASWEIHQSRIALIVQLSFFLLLGTIVFILPQCSSVPSSLIMDITTILIFIVGNLTIVTDAITAMARGDAALAILKDVESRLDKMDDHKEYLAANKLFEKKSFDCLELTDIAFNYKNADEEQEFSLGPIDLKIQTGEIIFIKGGNGSGKSTLLKTLCGLYYPQSGSIQVDGIVVSGKNYDDYREMFSIIFTDYHLFDRLYGMSDVDEARVNELIELMQLSSKTKYVDGQFTNTSLSTGQKKRLGLIISMLDDCPICIFDEVAADQDAEFRATFYEELLPMLQKQGKTIIAVTHDDRFHEVADRIIRIDYGKIEQ